MLQKLIDGAIRNRLLVALALLCGVIASVVILPKLNLDAFPDVTNVQVTVNTAAEGLAAEEVEKLISYPVESAMYALPSVTEVRSLSRTGLSIVTVVFAEGTDIYFARQQVFEQLQAAREMIPDGVGVPEIGPNTSGLGQIYQYILRATPESGIDAAELRSLNDYLVKLILMPVGGVTDVLSFGGEVRQYQVQIEPNKLRSYGLSMAQVTQRWRAIIVTPVAGLWIRARSSWWFVVMACYPRVRQVWWRSLRSLSPRWAVPQYGSGISPRWSSAPRYGWAPLP